MHTQDSSSLLLPPLTLWPAGGSVAGAPQVPMDLAGKLLSETALKPPGSQRGSTGCHV